MSEIMLYIIMFQHDGINTFSVILEPPLQVPGTNLDHTIALKNSLMTMEACIGYFGIQDIDLFFKGYWDICVFYFGIWDIQEFWDMGYWNLF